jgi:hypothetical protein
VNILQAINDKKVFASEIRGLSWEAWKVFLAALFALPMSEAELATQAMHRAQLAADSAVPGSVVGVRATCRQELHPLRDRRVLGQLL